MPTSSLTRRRRRAPVLASRAPSCFAAAPRLSRAWRVVTLATVILPPTTRPSGSRTPPATSFDPRFVSSAMSSDRRKDTRREKGVEIPYGSLSDDALRGLVSEFVTRLRYRLRVDGEDARPEDPRREAPSSRGVRRRSSGTPSRKRPISFRPGERAGVPERLSTERELQRDVSGGLLLVVRVSRELLDHPGPHLRPLFGRGDSRPHLPGATSTGSPPHRGWPRDSGTIAGGDRRLPRKRRERPRLRSGSAPSRSCGGPGQTSCQPSLA